MPVEIKSREDAVRIAQEMKSADDRINQILDTVGDGDLTGDLKSEYERLEGEAAEKADALKSFTERYEQRQQSRSRSEGRKALLQTSSNGLKFAPETGEGVGGYKPSRGEERAIKTAGEIFVESPEFQNWMKMYAPNGNVPDNDTVPNMPPIFLNGEVERGGVVVNDETKSSMKALITGASATSAGALVRRDYYNFVDLPRRQPMLRDYITELRTDSDLIEYVRFNSRTNNAAMVAEATTDADIGSGDPAVTTAQGGLKPQSILALVKVTTTVKTIAHYMAVTRRALADAPYMRTLIDSELREGIEEELEDQMITGDGTGENFNGLETVSGVTTQAFDTDLKTTLRKARTKVRTTARIRRLANVIVLMHPNDMEDYDLDQDAEDRYYTGGPRMILTPMIWGMPIVESEAITEGTAWVLDAKTLLLWNREQTVMRTTDSHKDWFARNLIAILAEARYAFGFTRPSAIIECDLTA